MLRTLLCCVVALCLATACTPLSQTSEDAGSSPKLARAAEREGELVIYANTGDAETWPVLTAFRRAHPGIKITFRRLNSAELYERYVAETAANKPTADLVWSSAMDLQIKLINDGYAQTYVPPQKAALPTWAVWKNQGYGVTAEPIVFVYDKRRLNPKDAPKSHAELRRLLETGKIPGSVATFDPDRSAVGFLYYSQDRLAWADTMALNRAIGATAPKLYESTATMLDDLSAGDTTFGYNIIGSYALEAQRLDHNLMVVFPADYTLVMSRIAFVSAGARHPNAAKLFLDFMLSKQGQVLLARNSLRPVRTDLKGGGVPGPADGVARPIEVGPALLADLDQMRRARLLADWRKAIGPSRKDDRRRSRDNIVTGSPP